MSTFTASFIYEVESVSYDNLTRHWCATVRFKAWQVTMIGMVSISDPEGAYSPKTLPEQIQSRIEKSQWSAAPKVG